MNGAHALFAPSGADRWMVCAGSLAMEAQEKGDTSEYADEGTVAHEVAKWCLTQDKDAHAWAGRRIEIVNGVYYPGTGPLPPNLWMRDKEAPIRRMFEVTEDMADDIQSYVQIVRSLAVNGELLVEQKLPIGHLTGEKDATGTSDAVVLAVRDDELIICDLKFGRGVRVFAKRNRQAMMYALGAIEEYDLLAEWKGVRIIIAQPRLNHTDEWTCTVAELQEFAKEVATAAKLATLALQHAANWIGRDDSYLVAEEKACMFCRAKAVCPKLARKVEESVGADFEMLGAIEKSGDAAKETFIKAKVTDAAEFYHNLTEKADALDLIEDFCKAVRGRLEAELLGGADIPGWKIVEGRKGNRAYSDPDKVEKMLKKMRYKLTEMYTMKLIGVPDCEKLLKKKPKQWEQVSALIVQPPGKKSVAKISDKRAALVIPQVEFESQDGSDLV
jgi:hypothetical protein